MALNKTADQLNIQKGSYLGNDHRVKDFLGQGGFGFVVQCYNLENDRIEAIKINKADPYVREQAKKEIAMLEFLQCLNPDTCNIVQYNGNFLHMDSICINFELLDQSLANYFRDRDYQPFSMPELSPIIKQMATALCHLRSIGVVHADVKPENIMVVDRHQTPLRVKLIDFGLAHPTYGMGPGACVQTTWYRAPEVILQMPFNQAIDMWSLGVTAAELATGELLYPGNIDYDVLSFIIATQGEPSDEVLDRGWGTCYYFNESSGPRRWRLKTPEEFQSDTGFCAKETRSMVLPCLDDLKDWIIVDPEYVTHQLHLVDLIKKMLDWDADKRIKPLEVLQHSFFTHRLPQTSDDDPWVEKDDDPWTETEKDPRMESHSDSWIETEKDPRIESHSDPRMDSDNNPWLDSENGPWMDTESDPGMESHSDPWMESHSDPWMDSDDDPWLDSENGSWLDSENGPWMDSQSDPWMDTESDPGMDTEDRPSTVSRESSSLHTAGPENTDCCVEIDSAFLADEEGTIEDVQPNTRTKNGGCWKQFIRGLSNICRYFFPCARHELSPPSFV